MRSSIVIFASLVGACRIVSSEEAALPIEGSAHRVECHYTLENCFAVAKDRCRHGYEQITRQNCPRCGFAVPPTPDKPEPIQRPGYYGVMYYRCTE